LRSMLYVRAVDVSKLANKYVWPWSQSCGKTKHELGVELMTWFV